jgi:hypothetical protein
MQMQKGQGTVRVEEEERRREAGQADERMTKRQSVEVVGDADVAQD